MLRCRYAYHLSLRGAIGAVTSIFAIAKIDVPIPHYSTVCKRQCSLQISQIKEQARKIRESKSPIDLIFDSTGLKGYGEGEWKIKKHDSCKASVWRMLHIAMSPDTFEIVWPELTDNRTHDSILLPIILSKIKKYGGKIDKVYGDKAYMSRACFEAIERSGGKAIIDIQKNVKINNKVKQRDGILRQIIQLGAKEWKKQSGYHVRSLAETQMCRWKKEFGERLMSRTFTNQITEIMVKTKILNLYTKEGMPTTVAT